MRVALQRLLHLQCEAIHAAAHVGHAGRKPHPHARWRQHQPRSTASTRRSAGRLTASSTRTRTPPASSISITPHGRGAGELDADAAAQVAPAAARRRSGQGSRRGPPSPVAAAAAARRQRYTRLGQIPCRSATSCTRAPLARDAATTTSRNAASCTRRRSPTISIRCSSRGSPSVAAIVAATVAASPLPRAMPPSRPATGHPSKAAFAGGINTSSSPCIVEAVPCLGHQEGRVDGAGGVIDGHRQVGSGGWPASHRARRVLMQHHPRQRIAWPLAPVRPAALARRQQAATMQERLGPGVAPAEAVMAHQVLVEVLRREPADTDPDTAPPPAPPPPPAPGSTPAARGGDPGGQPRHPRDSARTSGETSAPQCPAAPPPPAGSTRGSE